MGMTVFPEWVQSQKMVSRLAGSLGDTMNESSARAVLALKLNSPSAKRRRELAELANEGLLTKEDFAEYETCGQLQGHLALLQSKPRLLLKSSQKK